MIVKTAIPHASPDRLRRAGYEAERQMAFYLKRAFDADFETHIFHDLRLERAGEVAQMDHLVLHRFGLILIESKSVTTRVRVNARQEWAREYAGRWSGMPSPVLQAERQAQLLRSTLADHALELLGKVLLGLLQKGFGSLPIAVLVAISDSGVLEHSGPLESVCKADQVSERVRALMVDQRSLASLLSTDPRSKRWGLALSREELVRILAFLRAQHREAPLEGYSSPTHPSTSSPTVVAQPTPESSHPTAPQKPADRARDAQICFGPFVCKHCSSERILVVYGKYGYYFKCDACKGNTPLALTHPSTREKLRIRKQGRTFYAESEQTEFSVLFYTNPPD